MFYIQSSDLIRLGLPWWLNGKELACKCRTCRFDPWVGKIPWGREWQPTLVFLPGKSHRQRSLMGWRLWGLTELDLAGKKPACNAGDLGLIPGLGRSPGEGIGYPLQYSWAFLVAQPVKNPPASVEDLGLIPGLGRSPGEGNPLQYSGLENSMDSIVHGVTHSRTRLTFTFTLIELDMPEHTRALLFLIFPFCFSRPGSPEIGPLSCGRRCVRSSSV